MGKEKRSKKRRHSSSRSESSSRRSSYSRRSQSSQSYKHRSKRHKHKYDQRRKDEQKKNKKHNKEQKRKQQKQKQYRNRQRQQLRESENQRLPKRENQNSDLLFKQEIKSQNLKHQQIEAKILQQERQEYSVSGRPQRGNEYNPQNQIQQEEKQKKEQPCFEPSGILLEYYNAREGVSLRFHEPPEARDPQEQWRMYVFKGEQVLKPIMLTKSSYLIGKDDRVVDILAENPSISRQHCVIQFRLIQKRQTEGEYLQAIKPYVMDLQSTNGTFLNDQKIQSGRYYELLHRDVLKFGFSDRQYVIVKWEGDGQDQQAQDGK